MKYCLYLILMMTSMALAEDIPSNDPYLWLEDITGARALAWVQGRNEVTKQELEAQPGFSETRARLLSIFESHDRISYVTKQGNYFYNFWRDATHVRGVWRRTTLDEYRKPAPAWEVVLDLDALAAAEKENWIWAGAQFLHPTYDRCVVFLSRGGGDAHVMREFDVENKQFIADGFVLGEAKVVTAAPPTTFNRRT